MIIFRCDICKTETSHYRNLALTRKLISDQNIVQETKPFSFDVCSEKCEQDAFKKILSNFVRYENTEITDIPIVEVSEIKDE